MPASVFSAFCVEAQLSRVNGSPPPRCRDSDTALPGSSGCGEGGNKQVTGSSWLKWARRAPSPTDMFVVTRAMLSKEGGAQGSDPRERKDSIHRSWGHRPLCWGKQGVWTRCCF